MSDSSGVSPRFAAVVLAEGKTYQDRALALSVGREVVHRVTVRGWVENGPPRQWRLMALWDRERQLRYLDAIRADLDQAAQTNTPE